MNSDEAKFILQAYRHNEQDAEDPQIARALAQAERDPELAAWLAEDARLHRMVSDGLKNIPVPGPLKAQILAGGRIMRPTRWWGRPIRFAAAAALLLICALGVIILVEQGSRDFAEFRREMSGFLTTELTYLDHESTRVESLQRFLSQHDAPADFPLPQNMRDLVAIGCRVLNWHGRKVSLVCFHAGQGREVHLFVMDHSDWPELPPRETPVFASSGFWMTASWQEGGQAFLLAGKGAENDLRKLF